MIRVRRSHERGHADHGWLDTYHTFSFAGYHDPEHMGFRSLRVINEDRLAPGTGFGTHPHRDMEIVTYVLEGALEHRDSLGHGATLRPGELQRISAGTGILHSEFNPSTAEPVHLYQIWLLPDRKGLTPSYEQRAFPAEGRAGRWQRVAAPDGPEQSLTIHQDAAIFLLSLGQGQESAYQLHPERHAWLQVLRGQIVFAGQTLSAGDGAAVSGTETLLIRSTNPSEVMLFDLK